MAHIFKHPSGNSKGLIVFTHKEWGHFIGNKIIRKIVRDSLWPNFIPRKELRNPFYNKIKQISKTYYVSITFAGFQYAYQLDRSPFTSEIAELVFSPESTLPNLDPKLPRIPLNSRYFISKDFKNLKQDKIWDVITIGSFYKVKNYSLIFASIKKILETEPGYKFLLIVPSQRKVSFGLHKTIAQEFYQTFTREQQQFITFLYLNPELEMGLNQHNLIDFYNRSRVFTLFSRKEGESRVISEALCCGLPVVVYSNLLGGGRDLLTDQNSVMFERYEDAHLALLEALHKFKHGILDHPETITREDYAVKQLYREVKKFYQMKGAHFDDQLINVDHLDLRLPGHYCDLPWMLDKTMPTADILSRKQFAVFCKELDL